MCEGVGRVCVCGRGYVRECEGLGMVWVCEGGVGMVWVCEGGG